MVWRTSVVCRKIWAPAPADASHTVLDRDSRARSVVVVHEPSPGREPDRSSCERVPQNPLCRDSGFYEERGELITPSASLPLFGSVDAALSPRRTAARRLGQFGHTASKTSQSLC